MSLLNKIKTTAFSPSEQEIANYIIENKEKIATLTISDLAKNTYSSNAAIIRFCKKLGIDGYKTFRLEFVKELEKSRNGDIYVDFNYPIDSSDTANDILRKMANLYKATVENNYKEVDVDALLRIAKIIVDAQNVHLYATGDSEIRGQSFANKMIKLGKHIIDANYLSDPRAYATYATDKDCALFVSYSGEGFDVLLKQLKKNNVKIIALCAKENSTLIQYSDECIKIEDLEKSQDSIATFYSQISFDYVLNTLYSIIFSMHYAKNHIKKKTVLEL